MSIKCCRQTACSGLGGPRLEPMVVLLLLLASAIGGMITAVEAQIMPSGDVQDPSSQQTHSTTPASPPGGSPPTAAPAGVSRQSPAAGNVAPQITPLITAPLVSGFQAYDPSSLSGGSGSSMRSEDIAGLANHDGSTPMPSGPGVAPGSTNVQAPQANSPQVLVLPLGVQETAGPAVISSSSSSPVDGTMPASNVQVDPIAGQQPLPQEQPAPQPSTTLSWDLPAGSACSLNPVVDPEPQYCEPGLVCCPNRRVGQDYASQSAASAAGSTSDASPPYVVAAAAAAPGTQPDAAGVCAEPQPGLLLPRAYPTPWPTPAAYYPLTQDLDSFPGGQLYGRSHRTVFDSSDRRWGGSLSCDAATASFAVLPPPDRLGQQGGVAVSLWIKLPVVTPARAGSSPDSTSSGKGAADDAEGGGSAQDSYAYVLSLTQSGSTGSSSTNQVSIMLARQNTARFNTIRAVVRDGNDDHAPDTWLDSDGTTRSDSLPLLSRSGGGTLSASDLATGRISPRQNPNLVNVWDGEWHHVLVTSLPPAAVESVTEFTAAITPARWSPMLVSRQPNPQGSNGWKRQHGYRLFVDGLMRAELKSEGEADEAAAAAAGATGLDNTRNGMGSSGSASGHPLNVGDVSGGDAATLDNMVYLCSRADRDPLLFFTGQVAQLQFFNEGLSQASVASLYMEFKRQALIHPSLLAPPAGARHSNRGARCLMPLSFAGQLQYECLVLPSGTSSTDATTGTASTAAADAVSTGSNAVSGPACLTGPRGDWEPCDLESSSTVQTAVKDGNALATSAIDIDSTGAGRAPNTSNSRSATPTSTGTSTQPSAAGAAGTAPAVSLNISADVQARLAAAVGSTVYTYSHLLPRFTLSGQSCLDAPYWFDGKLVQPGQCTTLQGREVCPVPKARGPSTADVDAASAALDASVVEHYDMLQCDPLVAVPAFSTYCWISAMYTLPNDLPPLANDDSSSSSSSSDEGSFEQDFAATQSAAANAAVSQAALLFEGCVTQGALEFCKVRGQGGPWLLCPAGSAPQSALGAPCKLRYRYGSTSRTDCTASMAQSSGSTDSTPAPPLGPPNTAAQDRQLYCPVDSDYTGTQQISTDSMAVCSSSAAFSAATQDPEGNSLTASLGVTTGTNNRGYLGDPTAPIPGLPDGKSVLLSGLPSSPGSGARRYSMLSKQPCQPLAAPGMQLTGTSSTASNAYAALGRRGGASSVDGASAAASPGAGVASCFIDEDGGQFVCNTAATSTASSTSSLSFPSSGTMTRTGSISTYGLRQEVCAPVVRTTISRQACLLPFMWQGHLRDDCVWHNGMEVCPVLARAADRAAGSAYTPIAPVLAVLNFTAAPAAPGTETAGAAIGAALLAQGPWRWEQCTRDYVTKWDQPGASQQPNKRYGLSATSCVTPFVYQGETQWDCITRSDSNSSSSSSNNSSNGSGKTDAEPASSAALAGQLISGVLTSTLGVCPVASGGWEVCAPQPVNLSRATLSGTPCNLPFVHEGELQYDCIGSGNGTAGTCKDSQGTWQVCVDTSRTGKSSGKPCLLPALISAEQGLVLSGGSAAGSAGSARSSNSDTSSDEASDGSVSRDTSVFVTDCMWLSSGIRSDMQQQGQSDGQDTDSQKTAGTGAGLHAGQLSGSLVYVEVCYTDDDTLEECVPAGQSSLAGTTQTDPAGAIQLQQAKGRVHNPLNALAAPAPPQTTSTSRVVPLAVGIAVGVGGTLLLLAGFAAVAVKRGLVYQWRSTRFHEMELDPEMPPGSGGGCGAGVLGAGFAAAKARMIKPWQAAQHGPQDATGPPNDLHMQQQLCSGSVPLSAELTAAPSMLVWQKHEAGAAAGGQGPAGSSSSNGGSLIAAGSAAASSEVPSPFAAAVNAPIRSFSKAGSLLQRLLSSSSSLSASTASSTLLPVGSSVSSAPVHAGNVANDSSYSIANSHSTNSDSNPKLAHSTIELYDRSKVAASLASQPSASAAQTRSASPPVTATAAAGSHPSEPQPAGPDSHKATAPTSPAAAAAAASPVSDMLPSTPPPVTSTLARAATNTDVASLAIASSAGAAEAPGPENSSFPGNGDSCNSSNPVVVLPAAAAAFCSSQRPCYQAQLTGVGVPGAAKPDNFYGSSSNSTTSPTTDATASTTADTGDAFGVNGTVSTGRRPASAQGSMVGARILQFTAGKGALGQSGAYAAWDGGEAAAAEVSSGSEDGEDVGRRDAAGSAGGARVSEVAPAGPGLSGPAGQLRKLLNPLGTGRQQEADEASAATRALAAAAAAEPPGASGGSGLL